MWYKCSKLLWNNKFEIELSRLVLVVANRAHTVRKWMASSLPPQQSHISNVVSKHLQLQGSCIPNIDILGGRNEAEQFWLKFAKSSAVPEFKSSIVPRSNSIGGNNCLTIWLSYNLVILQSGYPTRNFLQLLFPTRNFLQLLFLEE